MLCQFTVSPIGIGDSLSREVSEIIDIIDRSGLPYKTHAMGTIVEGDWEEIFSLIRSCHLYMKRKNSRVITHIHVDDRAGANNRLTGKVESIETHLGRDIKK